MNFVQRYSEVLAALSQKRMRRITSLIRNFPFRPLINNKTQTVIVTSGRLSCIDHKLRVVSKGVIELVASNLVYMVPPEIPECLLFLCLPCTINQSHPQNNINRIGTLYRKTLGPMQRAYCTNCKLLVDIRSSTYVRLANHRAAIEGFCPICNSVLLNTRVMPTSSKKPMGNKRRRKKLSIYSHPNRSIR